MVRLGAIGILALTLGLSLYRPRLGRLRVQPASAALLGAILTVGGGLLSPREVLEVLEFLTMPVLTIVSLMIITIVASRAGFFRILAWQLAAGADGDTRRLFRRLFFAGTVTGTFFTNDAAVLIFTPMVYKLVEEIRTPSWRNSDCIPFYFAVLYVANLVGALVVSNPINIIVADWFEIGFVEYALWMVAPAVTSMVVTYLGLIFFFRDSMPARYRVPEPLDSRPDQLPFRWVSGSVLVLTLVGFFAEPWLQIPIAYVAAVGAVVLLLACTTMTAGGMRGVVEEVGWGGIIFVVGIFVVANGLRAVGLTDVIGRVLTVAGASGDQVGNLAAGLLATLSSAVINNHPTAGIMALSIGDLPIEPAARKMMALFALIGGDLGPKMLPIGSLAALLWFQMLRQRGVEISYWQYVRLGVPITLVAALLSMVVLALEYWLFV